MRALVIAVMMASVAPATARQSPPTKTKACQPANGIVDYQTDQTIRARPLAEMPPAIEMKALYRVVDDCPEPIVLRRGIGGSGEAPPPDLTPSIRPLR